VNGKKEVYNTEGDLLEKQKSELAGFKEPYVVVSNTERTHFIFADTKDGLDLDDEDKEEPISTKKFYSYNTLSNQVKEVKLPEEFPTKKIIVGLDEDIEYYFTTVYALSPNGRFLIAYPKDSTDLLLYDLVEGKFRKLFPIKVGLKINFSPDSKLIGIISPEGTILIQNLETAETHKWIAPTSGSKQLIAPVFSADNKSILISALENGSSVGVFTIDGTKISTLSEQHKATSISFSPTGRFLFKANDSSGVHIWDMQHKPLGESDNLRLIKAIENNPSLQKEVEHLLKEFDGSFVYSTSYPVFHRKLALYLLITFLGFMLVNRLMSDWDNGDATKVFYATPIYSLILMLCFLIPLGTSRLEELQVLFDGMLLILSPILLVITSVSSKDFIERKKHVWAVSYLLLGISLGLVGIYFPVIDYFNIISDPIVLLLLVPLGVMGLAGVASMKSITNSLEEDETPKMSIKIMYWLSIVFLLFYVLISLV
jgi:hypothetical protein